MFGTLVYLRKKMLIFYCQRFNFAISQARRNLLVVNKTDLGIFFLFVMFELKKFCHKLQLPFIYARNIPNFRECINCNCKVVLALLGDNCFIIFIWFFIEFTSLGTKSST